MAVSVTLRNGNSMPIVGFGTFRVKGRETIFNCLDVALKAGYRSIDTAVIYKNEEDIGLALEVLLNEYNLQRNDIFITSKLSPKDQGYESCINSVQQSLKLLKTKFLDLYLIHWPGASGIAVNDPENFKLRQDSWKALEHCQDQGLVKAIGVSNYCIKHLEEMDTYAKYLPQVLQVEHHPHYVQNDLLVYCKQKEIHYQAYSSLGTTVQGKSNPLLTDHVIQELASKYSKSSAQLLLRWATQQGIGVLPKSIDSFHIIENIQLDFHIKEDDIETLNNLEKKVKYAWNPVLVV